MAQELPASYVLHPLAGTSRTLPAPALEFALDGPSGLAEDADGNIYVSESNAGVIRRIRPDGMMERFAGTGVIGDGDEGAPALETNLTSPTHLLIDKDGGLIFADSATCRIRKVQKNGTVLNLAGTGSCTQSGFGFGGGSSSRLHSGVETLIYGIGGIALDNGGRLVFSELNAHVIRRLDFDGYVRTIAGTGVGTFSGDGAAATSASFLYPAGLVFDPSGNLYIGDGSNCRVRRIDSDGNISTVAGSGTCATSATTFSAGAATRSIGRVAALAYDSDSDSILLSTPNVYRVLRLDLSAARLFPFFGNGRTGADSSADPLAANVNDASAILVSASAGVLVAGRTSYQVWSIRTSSVQGFAGRWPQLDAYPTARSAALVRPTGLSISPDGSLLIVDTGAERVLQLQSFGELSGVAGARYPSGFSQGDGGAALQASLSKPDRAIQISNGEIFITQGTKIRVVDTQGVIRTVLEFLSGPSGVIIDAEGRLVFSESDAHRVVRYDPVSKTKTVIAGTGTAGFDGDGEAASAALLNSPGDLALDSSGNLLIADRGNRRVRRISHDGTIQTVIGSSRGFSYSDISGQPASDTGLGRIYGIAVDRWDNIYTAEASRISVVSNDGRIRVVTGFLAENDDGTRVYRDGPINGIGGLAVDQNGRVYFSLTQEGRVLVANPAEP